LCGKYLDNVKAFVTREKVVDPAGRESEGEILDGDDPPVAFRQAVDRDDVHASTLGKSTPLDVGRDDAPAATALGGRVLRAEYGLGRSTGQVKPWPGTTRPAS